MFVQCLPVCIDDDKRAMPVSIKSDNRDNYELSIDQVDPELRLSYRRSSSRFER